MADERISEEAFNKMIDYLKSKKMDIIGLPTIKREFDKSIDHSRNEPHDEILIPAPAPEHDYQKGWNGALDKMKKYLEQQMRDNTVSVHCNPYDYFNIPLVKIAELRKVK